MIERLLNNRVSIGAVAILLLSTCLYLPYIQSSRDNRTLLIGILCLACVSGLLWRYTKLGALLLGFVTIRFYFATSDWIGTPIYTIFCMSLLLLVGLRTYPQWKDKKELIYNTICLVALLNVVFQVLQFNGIHGPLKFRYDMSLFRLGACGLMGNPNEVSCLLAMCLPMFFRKQWRLGIIIVVIGLFLAKSLVGFVAGGAATVFYVFLMYDKNQVTDSLRRIIIVLSVCFLLGVYAVKIDRLDIPEQVKHRGMVYATTAKVALVKWQGWGFGQYQYVMPLFTFSGSAPAYYVDFLLSNVTDMKGLEKGILKITGTKDVTKAREYFAKHTTPAPFAQAHNEYLEFFFSTGIIGSIFALLFMFSVMRSGVEHKDKLPVLCLIASGVSAMFFFPWQIVPTAILTVAFIVMIIGEKQCEVR